MGTIFLALGASAFAVHQFGDADMRERHGNRLLLAGVIALSLGAGLLSDGSSGCETSWGTHGTYDDC